MVDIVGGTRACLLSAGSCKDAAALFLIFGIEVLLTNECCSGYAENGTKVREGVAGPHSSQVSPRTIKIPIRLFLGLVDLAACSSTWRCSIGGRSRNCAAHPRGGEAALDLTRRRCKSKYAMLLLKQQHDDIGYLRSLHVYLTSQVFLRRVTRAVLLVEPVHIEQDTPASLRYGR